MKSSKKPSNTSENPKLDPSLERLAKRVVKREYADPPSATEVTEDSRAIALRMFPDFLPDDRRDRILREPGNEHLFDENIQEGVPFISAVALYRGDISSALDFSTSNFDDEENE